jgi:hypothetical protein
MATAIFDLKLNLGGLNQKKLRKTPVMLQLMRMEK